MRLRIVLTLLCLYIATVLFSQNISVQGILVDTLQEPLMSATVVLLNPQDSTMEYFAITTISGNFKMKGVKPGEYIFQSSYVGFESRYKNVDLREEKGVKQIGAVVLRPENKLLGEVTVNGERIPILIKKDTVEYNAGSFKVKPNANVEALLRKLPGVEVQKDGTIRAHGEEVQSIKVDGKDFGAQPASGMRTTQARILPAYVKSLFPACRKLKTMSNSSFVKRTPLIHRSSFLSTFFPLGMSSG